MQPKFLILIGLIIGACILGYGYLKYDYGLKTIEVQRQDKAERQELLRNCSEAAETDYSTYWDAQCPLQGMDTQSAGCNLPRYVATDIELRREKALDNCVKLFSPQ